MYMFSNAANLLVIRSMWVNLATSLTDLMTTTEPRHVDPAVHIMPPLSTSTEAVDLSWILTMQWFHTDLLANSGNASLKQA